MLFQIPQCLGPCLFDTFRTHVGDEGDSECRWRQWILFQIEEGGAELEQLDRSLGVGEVAVSLSADDQRVPGDALRFRKPESRFPIPEFPLLVALC